MQFKVDVRYFCADCKNSLEVEMDYNPTMESMPPMPTNYVRVTPCEGCIIKRITKALRIMKEEEV